MLINQSPYDLRVGFILLAYLGQILIDVICHFDLFWHAYGSGLSRPGVIFLLRLGAELTVRDMVPPMKWETLKEKNPGLYEKLQYR
jgi:hypothetical protein